MRICDYGGFAAGTTRGRTGNVELDQLHSFRCMDCGRTFFRSSKQLDRLAVAPRCDRCGAAGEETEASHRRHYHAAKRLPQGDLTCPHCWKHFRNPAALNLHVQELHDVGVGGGL